MRVSALFVLVAFSLIVATHLWGLTVTVSESEDTEAVGIGSVTGTHGDEGDVTNSETANQRSVRHKYGFHCSGKECNGTDEPPPKENFLQVVLTREEDETGTLACWAYSQMYGKQAKQTTKDWSCPGGPPTFTATGEVKLSKPSSGSPGADSDGGRIKEAFTHSVSPTTAWLKSYAQYPVPSGIDSTNYDAQYSNNVNVEWVYDPNNPSTNSLTFTAKVTTDVDGGSAKEIEVTECYLRAYCELKVGWPAE